MNPNTGELHADIPDADLTKNGLVRISRREFGRLVDMPPAKRAEALLTSRAMHPLAKLPGLTDDDIRALRNAAKRERRALR